MTNQEALKLLNDMEFAEKYQGKQEYTDMLLLCKKALEKQIPKKPILDTIFPSGVKWYLCPTCNHNGIEKVGCYCHNCGQALDWSDSE